MTTENTTNSVGEAIRSYRESSGLTLRQFAEILDVPFTSLSKMEVGDQRVDSEILIKVADYFNVSLDQMLNRSLESTDNDPNPGNASITIRDVLENIMMRYLSAKNDDFKEHPVGEYVRNTAKNVLLRESELNENDYFVVGSVGQGQWAEVPWLSTYARKITTTATKGYYVVYLFKADMSGVYVSLNQGWTYFKEKYGTKIGRKKIVKTASMVREQLNTVPAHLQETEIDLKSTGDLGKGYESGHIFGRYYDLHALPSAKEIINDLQALSLAYKEIEGLIGNRTIEQFNDDLLLMDDGQFLEEEDKEVQYQEKVQERLLIEGESEKTEEEELPEERPEPVTDKGGKKRWPRDTVAAATALRQANYRCAYDPNHTTFTSKATKKPYTESHHLVPMKLQGSFKYKLDRTVNILSLCASCHRTIHLGIDEVKEIMLRKFYDESRDLLEKVGIEITFSDLKKAYNIDE